MIKFFKVMLMTILMGCGAETLAADSTNQAGQVITNIRFDGAGKNLYFETEGKWDANGCDATYIWVKPTVLGQQEILSIALAAKMANKKVRFAGECDENNNYFKAHYITML